MHTGLKITIIGPGAMGCLLAGYISRSGLPVSILDYKSDRAKRLSKNGIYIETGEGNFQSFPRITADASTLGAQDAVLVLVKAGQTANALKQARPLIGEGTVVVSLQNGIGHEETLSNIAKPESIALGVTTQGATLLREGCVKHAGQGETTIGLLKAYDLSLEKLNALSRLLTSSGWPCSLADDIFPHIWKKLLANVGVNALAALTGIKNGDILTLEHMKRLQGLAVIKAWKVAAEKGIKINLDLDEAVEYVRSVCTETAGNISSMLQDRILNKPTEIDYINGAIVRMAGKLGIDTPVNEVLSTLVKVSSARGWKPVKPD